MMNTFKVLSKSWKLKYVADAILFRLAKNMCLLPNDSGDERSLRTMQHIHRAVGRLRRPASSSSFMKAEYRRYLSDHGDSIGFLPDLIITKSAAQVPKM
jgi:hypothetical protein